MTSFLQVISCRSVDTNASFLIFTDNDRYLINCGEGTQRVCGKKKKESEKVDVYHSICFLL